MANIVDIIDGHIREFANIGEDLSKSRLKICYRCPLYSPKLGGICNSKLWLDPNTEDVSTYSKPGYIRGCGCLLNRKVRLSNATCIANKW